MEREVEHVLEFALGLLFPVAGPFRGVDPMGFAQDFEHGLSFEQATRAVEIDEGASCIPPLAKRALETSGGFDFAHAHAFSPAISSARTRPS